MHQTNGWIYLLASAQQGALYCGVTTDLIRRVRMHKAGVASHYTRKYAVTSLVWYERHASIVAASRQSDLIRHRSRQWKLDLIEQSNPDWLDLFNVITVLPDIPRCSIKR
jgi:putative endonuclease